MKKMFIALNVILISCIVAGDICYAIFGGLWLKGLTSAGFVALAIANLIYAIKFKCANLKFAIVMLVGFVFAMAGDIVLNIRNMFIVGALLFAVGHIFYFVAYCLLQKFKWVDLIPGAIILVPSVLVITLVPIFNFGGVLMEVVCVVYAIIISLMLGKAISNLIRQKNALNWLIVIGSFLFFFSD
ncbi:MAG: lysoplasmalogenase, partial [Clostridia bacterium]|nr:lysoplasmalogenase [Clostridia bacterium]